MCYRLSRATLAGCALSLGVLTHAQEAPAAPPAKEEKVITLSPFEVNAEDDQGYVAANTLAGSRLNTALRDTPVSISVMTKDFIRDIGAINVNEAMEYAAGAGNDIGGGGAGNTAINGNNLVSRDYNFAIRGYRSAQVTRDFFPTILGMDAFNLDRIDISRGPNAILFGVGGAGGIVNLTPKRAVVNQTFTEVETRVASWDSYRAALDYNLSALDGKLGARLNLMAQDAEGYRDFESDDQRRGALAATWRPTESTTIRIDSELGWLHQNRVRPWGAIDGFSAWEDAGKFYHQYGSPETPGNTGSQNYTQAVVIGQNYERRSGNTGAVNYFMDGPLAGKTVASNPNQMPGSSGPRQRYYRVSHNVGVAGFDVAPTVDDENIQPRTANLTGPGSFVETDYYSIGATLEQRIGKNLFLEFAANRSHVDRQNRQPVNFNAIAIVYDVTSTLPTFTSSGAYNATDTSAANGPGALDFPEAVPNPYVGQLVVKHNPTYDNRESYQDDYRVSATYHLDLGWAGDHNLLAFASRAVTGSETQNWAETNVNPYRADPTTYFHGSNYDGRIVHIDLHSANLADRGVPDPWTHPLASGPYYGAPQFHFTPGWVKNGWSRTETTLDSAAIAAQSAFWQRRIITTAGIRRDSIEVYDDLTSLSSFGESQNPTRRPAASIDQTADTYTIGAIVRVPKLDWLSIYGNQSTNFASQGDARLFGNQNEQELIGPREGKGTDYGVKMDLFSGRVSATVGLFEVEATREATGINGNISSYINAMWTAIANNGPGQDVVDTHRVGGGDSRSRVSKGWEAEIVANPTKNWRLSFNVSESDNVVSGLMSSVSSYVAANRAAWEAKSTLNYDNTRSPGNLSNAGGFNTIGALIHGLDSLIAIEKANEGRPEVNIRPLNANAFTAYSFSHGALKNFTVGVGANYRGPEIQAVLVDPVTNELISVVKGNDYYLLNGMISYERKIWHDVRMRLQLNVENLLNNQDRQTLASGVTPAVGPDGTAIPGGTPTLATYSYFFEPRRYSLTASFRF